MCRAFSLPSSSSSLLKVPEISKERCPPFATAHTFCASRDGTSNSEFFLSTVPTDSNLFFARFLTMRGKKMLTRDSKFQREIKCYTLLRILKLFRIIVA